MRTRSLPLALTFILASCFKPYGPPPTPVEDNPSIAFPPFFEQPAGAVGTEGILYDLDGEMLRAVMIAANDLLPLGAETQSCANKHEAQRYRVIRQGSIIFVYIYEDPTYCGYQHLSLDSGAKYAISTDGRILRRVLDGQPEGLPGVANFDDGGLGVPSRPGVTPAYDAIWNKPSSPTSQDQDGGLAHPADGGTVDAGR